MKLVETQKVTNVTETVSGCKCDVCNSEIQSGQIYWTLLTGHHDWGNDSCDSIEDFDLCSEDCVKEKLSEYFKACEDSSTQYFELAQERFYPGNVWDRKTIMG